MSTKTQVHPSAVIDSKAEIDSGVVIGPYCTIGPNVKIGKNTKLISHVVVDGDTQIGEANTVFPFAVLGAVPQDLKYKGETTKLIIGDRNQIRECVTLNLGTVQGGGVTRVGSDNLLMAYVHLGHDCHIKNHTILANAVNVAGHVTIENYASIGGMCGVTQFVTIGEHTYFGGQSTIDRDVPPYCIALGQRPLSVKGANIVGLRRRGFSADVITKINETIKLWTRPDVEKERCLLEIESQYSEIAEIQKFIKFIRQSENGVAR